MITLNKEKYFSRAEILREKGTNRSAFFRGEVAKYNWVDIGSSFLPSDIIAAFLFAQLENLEDIQTTRKAIWDLYHQRLELLEKKGHVSRPFIPSFATQNGHMYYIVCQCFDERSRLISFLREKGIYAVFHYLSLHTAPYFEANHDGRLLPQSDHFTDCLLRLPLFYELEINQVNEICDAIEEFFRS